MSTMLSGALRVHAAAALVLLTAACNDRAANAPITTTTPAGQSTAPAPAAAERADHALVRFVHAVPGGGAMDLFADDNRTFDAVDYKATTPYREVDGQYYTFRLRQAGKTTGDPLASNTEGLDDGDYYTVFAVPGDRNTALLRVVEDDFSTPDDGKARVRVVHAARTLGEVDVLRAGTTDQVFGGVDFQSVTDYDEIDPWSGGLDVRAEGAETALATVNVQFEAGKVYTIVVAGAQRGRTAPDAFVIEDQMGAARPAATTLDR
jgi:hypothetical protein